MNFDNCIQPHDHHNNQDTEQLHHPEKFPPVPS